MIRPFIVFFEIIPQKIEFMKMYISLLFLVFSNITLAQSLSKMPDSVRKVVDEYTGVRRTDAVQKTVAAEGNIIDNDDQVKAKLVKLALKNIEITEADANIRIAEISRKKANSSMLSSINLGGNANEFVIKNSPQANFFPKYNLAISIPLDLVARNKAEKRTADQMIIISEAQKERLEKSLRAKVLVAYETYKEKKELVQLQKISMEDDIAAYERAQIDFKDEAITLEELNKIYKSSVVEKSFLASKEKDLNIAIIQLEEIIGVPLEKALGK